MSRFNIRSLDLNLLSVFVILWDTRSVSRSDRLALTQPAVSHALKRLRERLDDALFVPGRQGLVPTARATELINPVRKALTHIEQALEDAPPFEPAEAHREFRIAAHDLVEFWLLPALVETVSKEAPGVVIRIVPVPEPGSVSDLLESGDIDVVIGGQPLMGMSVRSKPLSQVKLVTLIWKREDGRTLCSNCATMSAASLIRRWPHRGTSATWVPSSRPFWPCRRSQKKPDTSVMSRTRLATDSPNCSTSACISRPSTSRRSHSSMHGTHASSSTLPWPGCWIGSGR